MREKNKRQQIVRLHNSQPLEFHVIGHYGQLQIQAYLRIVKIFFQNLPDLIQPVIDGIAVDIQGIGGLTHILIVPEIPAQRPNIGTLFAQVRLQQFFEGAAAVELSVIHGICMLQQQI